MLQSVQHDKSVFIPLCVEGEERDGERSKAQGEYTATDTTSLRKKLLHPRPRREKHVNAHRQFAGWF